MVSPHYWIIVIIKKKNFTLALTYLSTFDDEIENFFENVVINVDKSDIKINRLKLCNKIRKLMHSVAYFGQLNFWCYLKYVNERKL